MTSEQFENWLGREYGNVPKNINLTKAELKRVRDLEERMFKITNELKKPETGIEDRTELTALYNKLFLDKLEIIRKRMIDQAEAQWKRNIAREAKKKK